MTLDPDQRIAIIGTPGNGDVMQVEQTAGGGLRLPLGVGRTFAFSIPAVAACGASSSTTISASSSMRRGRLSGTGHGQWATYDTGGGINLSVTMILDGVPDADPPTLSLVAGGDLADPWTPLWVVASEPLPGRATAARAPVDGR